MAVRSEAEPPLPVQGGLCTGGLATLPIVSPITPQGDGESGVEMDLRGLQALVERMQEDGGEDVEVAVVAVMGKLRGGKSFLLNLLVPYFLWLERNQERLRASPRRPNGDFRFSRYGAPQGQDWLPEWLPEGIDTPFQVDAVSDAETCTRGLWILNRPFLLRKPHRWEERVALLLLDSQGADDGLLSEAQSRAIFGITTALSSAVVYNVRTPLDTKHVKDLSDLANIFQVALADIGEACEGQGRGAKAAEGASTFGRLLVLLRDAKFEPGSSLSECRGKLAREAANKLDPGRAKINRERVEELRRSFEQPMAPPFGLPHPGAAADFAQSRTTASMRELSDDFKVMLDEFARANFEADFPVPVRRCFTNKALTARTLIPYLERIKDAFAACTVVGGDPELVSMHLEEVAEDAFASAVSLLKPEQRELFPLAEVEEAKRGALSRFEAALGQGLPAEVRRRWTKRFVEFMEGHVARVRGRHIEQQGHGDRAVAATAAVAAVAAATPLGGWVLGHWLALLGACFGGLGLGYLRHARDRRQDPVRMSTVGSFLRVSGERCHDMALSAKRLGARASACR